MFLKILEKNNAIDFLRAEKYRLPYADCVQKTVSFPWDFSSQFFWPGRKTITAPAIPAMEKIKDQPKSKSKNGA